LRYGFAERRAELPMRQIKTPMMMRLEAERGPRRPLPPPGDSNPAARPPLASEAEEQAVLDATASWLGHIQVGRIPVR
jgi:hypothetical protein